MGTVEARANKFGKKKYIYGAHKGELEALSVSLTGSFAIELNTHWAQGLKKLHMRFE